VCSDAPGMNEVVLDGVNGLLAPPGDASALAEALDRLLSDPELRRRMGQAGRERVSQVFTLSRQAEETVRVFERLLRNCPRTNRSR